jgi:mRNA interferase RelE/StbE
MSFYSPRVPDRLVGLIRGLHPDIKRKIKGSLKMIVDEPSTGKPMKEELQGLRSFRMRRFRIVYRITESREIQIVAIGPRERMYEETYRIIRKETKGGKRK